MLNSSDFQFDPAREYRVNFLDVEVRVEIEPDNEDGSLSPAQNAALGHLLAPTPYWLELSAPAVMQNYEVYREVIGDEELPPLARPVEVWKGVKPDYFRIPLHYGFQTPTFFLLAECDWDPEHGLEVRFRDGVADASSQQGDLGLED